MKSDLFLSVRCLILLFICSFFSGCASLGHDFPKSYHFKPPEIKPSIDYDVKYFWTNRENSMVLAGFQKEINKVFAENQLFSKYNAGTGKSDYHFSIIMRDEGDENLATISGIITGLSLGIIPTKATDNYILTIDVKKGDKVIKQYQYNNYMVTWFHLFLLPMAKSHSPGTMQYQIWDNMLRAFLQDLDQDILVAKSVGKGD